MTEPQPEVTMNDLKAAAEQYLEAALERGEAQQQYEDEKRSREFCQTPQGVEIIRYIGRPVTQLIVEKDYEEPAEGPEESVHERNVSVFWVLPRMAPHVTVTDTREAGSDPFVPPEQHGRIAAELLQLLGTEQQ